MKVLQQAAWDTRDLDRAFTMYWLMQAVSAVVLGSLRAGSGAYVASLDAHKAVFINVFKWQIKICVLLSLMFIYNQ